MGRVYDTKIKRIGSTILATYGSHLSTDFRSNKEFLVKVLDTHSKFIINKVAGYVTSQVRRQLAESQAEQEPEPEAEQVDGAA
ncbi:MAG TPA: 30S ribosomal protein S17e [Thermoproteota archaeon]|nr:30S ribosomal protein S17e [Thermoproteota archaeon]